MKKIAKVLFIILILLMFLSVGCKSNNEVPDFIRVIFPDQEFIGPGRCGGVVRRIFLYEGPNKESITEIKAASEVLYEEEILFVSPHEIETIGEETVYLKGLNIDAEVLSVTFGERHEPSSCYVSQIGEIRWRVTSVDCYRVEAKKQEFTLIDESRGISEWRDTDPLYFWVQIWEEDMVLESAVLLDGSVVKEPETCLVKERSIVYYQARVRPKLEMSDGWITEPFGYQYCAVVLREETEPLTYELVVMACSLVLDQEFSDIVLFEPDREVEDVDIAPVYRIEYADGRVEYEWFRKYWPYGAMICGGFPDFCDED